MEEIIQTDFYKVYPNPASTNVIVELKNENFASNYSVVVYSLLGKQVIRKEGVSAKYFVLDISELIDGAYFINIETNKNKSSKVFIKNSKSG